MKKTKSMLCLLAVVLFVFALLPTSGGLKVRAAENSALRVERQNYPNGKAHTKDAAADLSKAVKIINDLSRLLPKYGVDHNIYRVIEQKLQEGGVTGVKVSALPGDINVTTEVTKKYANIDPATGDITYLFLDPSKDAEAANMGTYTANIFFTVSKDGQTKKANNRVTVMVKWDENRIKEEILRAKCIDAFDFNAQILPNKASDITEGFNLPGRINSQTWFKIEWTTSDPATLKIGGTKFKNGSFLEPYYPVTVTKPTVTKNVVIKAKYIFEKTDWSQKIYLEKEYLVTVKGSQHSEIDDMNADLEKIWKPENLQYFSNEHQTEQVKLNDLKYDLLLPRPQKMSDIVPDFYDKYVTTKVTYYSVFPEMDRNNPDDCGMQIYALRTYVRRPQFGKAPKKVTLRLTLTSLQNPNLKASRDLEFTINPMGKDEFMQIVNRKARLMELTKLKLFDVLNSNPLYAAQKNLDQNHVTGNLSDFQEVFFADEADTSNETLKYVYNYSERQDRGVTIKETLKADGTRDYWVNSSRPDIIGIGNLLYQEQPDEDTKVTISMKLNIKCMDSYRGFLGASSHKGAFFANVEQRIINKIKGEQVIETVQTPAGAGDEITDDDRAKLASLFDQDVKLEITVLGKNHQEPTTTAATTTAVTTAPATQSSTVATTPVTSTKPVVSTTTEATSLVTTSANPPATTTVAPTTSNTTAASTSQTTSATTAAMTTTDVPTTTTVQTTANVTTTENPTVITTTEETTPNVTTTENPTVATTTENPTVITTTVEATANGTTTENPTVVTTTENPTVITTTKKQTVITTPTSELTAAETTAQKPIFITTAARKIQPTNAHTPATGERDHTPLAVIFMIFAIVSMGSLVARKKQI